MDRNVFELVSRPFLLRQGREIELHDSSNQKAAYKNLISIVTQRSNMILQGDRIEEILSLIERNVFQAISKGSKYSKVTLISGKAVLDHVSELQAKLDRTPVEEQITIIVSQIAAIIVETSYANTNDFQLQHSRYSLSLQTEIASYASWRTITAFQYAEGAPLQEIADRFERDRMQLAEQAEKQLAEVSERLIQLRAQEDDLQKAIRNQKSLAAGLAEEMRNTTNQGSQDVARVQEEATAALATVHTTKENFEAFRTAIIEEVRGKETRQLWKERDVQNWLAFKISAGILAALLIAVPILGLVCLDWVIATLRHIGDAAVAGIPDDATGTQLAVAAISRLVVITFPLVLYLWIIRLVVRFNSRSLLLHDDARQRQTMMDMYFLLVERNAATPEERGLVLNALFRPAPGHGSESVDPPKFTDLLPNVPKSS